MLLILRFYLPEENEGIPSNTISWIKTNLINLDTNLAARFIVFITICSEIAHASRLSFGEPKSENIKDKYSSDTSLFYVD